MTILELDDVSAGYDEIQVLWDVNLEVAEGELVSVIGNNGAGKTTMMRTIIGWITPTSGQLIYKGDSMNDLETRQRSRQGITIAPEESGVFPDMTVIENLRLGAYGVASSVKSERLDRVYDLFPRLEERVSQKAGTLSGGERKMLNIGSALMSDPELLLIDEPSLGLAPMLADELLDEIGRINDQGTTILLVEQSVNKALALSDRTYVLENGRIVADGKSEEMRDQEDIREAYLGK